MVARSTPSMFTIYCLKSTQCLMFKELTKDSPNKKILASNFLYCKRTEKLKTNRRTAMPRIKNESTARGQKNLRMNLLKN